MLAVGFLSTYGGTAKSLFGRNGRRINRSVEKRFDLWKRLSPNSHGFSAEIRHKVVSYTGAKGADLACGTNRTYALYLRTVNRSLL